MVKQHTLTTSRIRRDTESTMEMRPLACPTTMVLASLVKVATAPLVLAPPGLPCLIASVSTASEAAKHNCVKDSPSAELWLKL